MVDTMKFEMGSKIDLLSQIASPLVIISELIKNSFDENAKKIKVSIDTYEKTITVIDDGFGFTESSIKMLDKPGQSYKKINGNLINKNKQYYSGSKGLGLYSVFAISEYITIYSNNNKNEQFLINWSSSEEGKILEYKKLEGEEKLETIIILRNVSEEALAVLLEDVNNGKVNYITENIYSKKIKFPNILFFINGEELTLNKYYLKDIYEEDERFIMKVAFSYKDSKNMLCFNVERKEDSRIIKDRKIEILLNEYIDMKKILYEEYAIKEFHKVEGTDLNHLPDDMVDLPDFEGEFYIYRGQKKKKIKTINYGVRVFINGFSLYNYINSDYDWLNFSPLSQVGKFTSVTKHNVFGSIRFYNFNENKENLLISNERSHFLDINTSYRKFHEIVYKIVTLLTFNIDVVCRAKDEKYFDKEKLRKLESEYKKVEKDKETEQVKQNNSEQTLVESLENKTRAPKLTKSNGKPLKDEMLHIGTHINLENHAVAIDYKGELLGVTVSFIDELNPEEEGKYRIVFSATDDKGKTTSKAIFFTIYNPNNREKTKTEVGQNYYEHQYFYFTDEERKKFIFPTGDLSKKINDVIDEMHNLRGSQNMIALTALFRILIELSCRKACAFYDLNVSESLATNVSNVYNKLRQKLNRNYIEKSDFDGEIPLKDKHAKELKKEISLLDAANQGVKKESLIDRLNLYIHEERPIPTDFMEDWNKMKTFLIACLMLPEKIENK